MNKEKFLKYILVRVLISIGLIPLFAILARGDVGKIIFVFLVSLLFPDRFFHWRDG
jgi:hypothetical protein